MPSSLLPKQSLCICISIPSVSIPNVPSIYIYTYLLEDVVYRYVDKIHR